ncbi:hypothetical protein GC173_11435 [bacterium]|nr:hypothetical protein [bacterium]
MSRLAGVSQARGRERFRCRVQGGLRTWRAVFSPALGSAWGPSVREIEVRIEELESGRFRIAPLLVDGEAMLLSELGRASRDYQFVESAKKVGKRLALFG